MLWTPNAGGVRVVSNSNIVGGQIGATVQSGGSASTYGSVVEVISAATNDQDSWGIEVCVSLSGPGAAARQCAVDILIGGATDDVLISSLLCGSVFQGAMMRYFFPVHVPGGLRLAARSAHLVASTNLAVAVFLYGGGVPPFRVGNKVTTYGTKATDARGVTVVPTASGGAASVTQMTAASSRDHSCFMVGFQSHDDATLNDRYVNLGIGVGASTEERIGTWWWTSTSTEQCSGYVPGFPAFRDVPAGTRLSILASNSAANDTGYNGLIYAV